MPSIAWGSFIAGAVIGLIVMHLIKSKVAA